MRVNEMCVKNINVTVSVMVSDSVLRLGSV